MILVILKESKKEGRKMGRRGEGKGEGKEGGRKKRKEKRKESEGKRGEEIKRGGKVSKKEEDRKKRRGKKSVVYRSQLLGPWRQRPLILLLYACNPTAPTGTGTTEC